MFLQDAKNAGLNISQRNFCKTPITKNIRLLAPAGSGKTFSLLWRCAYINEQHNVKGKAKPHFLIVTFTKSACTEIEQRLSNDPNFKDIQAKVRTLNSWGWEQVTRAGIQPDLCNTPQKRISLAQHDLNPVYDSFPEIKKAVSGKAKIPNSKLLLEIIDAYKSLGFVHTMNRQKYADHILYLKNAGLKDYWERTTETLHYLLGTESEDKKTKAATEHSFFAFWKKATVALERVRRFTFEDQKYWACITLEKCIAERNFSSDNNIDYILVDEFQYFNPLDLHLIQNIRLYYGKGKSIPLTIVGDDDQAIFGWRGSSPKFIIHPEEYFKNEFATCILDTNYRSPKNIVIHSDKLIRHNKERVQKEMKSLAKGRAYIKINRWANYNAVLDGTIKLVHDLIDNRGCRNIALIARRHAQLFPYQILFSAEKTNYDVAADIDIFEGEAMQSLLEIIRIVYRAKANDCDNPTDDLLMICDKIYRYKIAKKDRQAIGNFIEKNGRVSFEEALARLAQYPEPIKDVPAGELVRVIKKLISSKNVYSFMQLVETEMHGFDKNYEKRETDNHYKEPQFFRLTQLAKRYGDDFKRFRQDIESARSASNKGTSNEQIPINLVTATRSKGKEFDAVIVLDAEDKEWPIKTNEDIEEERRLFYVAMTRAKRYLFFSASKTEKISRFIIESELENSQEIEVNQSTDEQLSPTHDKSEAEPRHDFFTGCKTWADIKKRYRVLSGIYNPGSTTGESGIMKDINIQFDKLKKDNQFKR